MLFWISVLWTLLFYSLSRLEYLIWNFSKFNGVYAGEIASAFLHGLRFDLMLVLALALPSLFLWGLVCFLRKGSPRFFTQVLWISCCVFQIPALILNWGDAEFVNFTGRRFNAGTLFNIGEMKGGVSLGILKTHWHLCLLLLIMIVVYAWGLRKILNKWGKKIPLSKSGKGKIAAQYFISLCLIFLGIRGGFQPKPLGLGHAQIFIQSELNLLALNSGFVVLKSFGQPMLNTYQVMPEEEMLANTNGRKPEVPLIPASVWAERFPQKPNVVVIILESLSLEYVGFANGGDGYTPFLDELAAKSLFFTNAFANGRRSIEGIASILAGIPALMAEPFVSSNFSMNRIVGLGQVFREQSYQTLFFHGGNNGTMFFDTFTKAAGFDQYFGAKEYPKPEDHDGAWGIYDEPFLQWAVQKMDESQKPFLAGVFTLSSHHPFLIPKQHQNKFKKGPQDIHESLGYVDYSLRQFFETVKTKSWFHNTIFVITADHTYRPFKPEYQNEMGRYLVPLLFYIPDFKWSGSIDTKQPVSHIDILPSLADMAGITLKEKNYLTRSIFRQGPRFVVFGMEDRYYFVKDSIFYRRNLGGDAFAGPALIYDRWQDLAEKIPLSIPGNKDLQPEIMDRELSAQLQYFNQAMRLNKLYFSP